MPRILVISSWVARGHVGLSAALPVLHGLGCETLALPTVILSNHPGHARVAGRPLPVAQLEGMLSALSANGWLAELSAVLTGYLPTPGHVAFAAAAVARVRAESPAVHVCCDPILGDDPGGLYVPEDVAVSLRSDLLPLADTVTPNRFELDWLTGIRVQDVAQATLAGRTLARALTLVTSVPAAEDGLANVAVSQDAAWMSSVQQRDGVPHGTGDALAAAFLAATVLGHAPADALSRATGYLSAMIEASIGADELQLASLRNRWTDASPAAVTRLC
jgi:pyridoxine kinase